MTSQQTISDLAYALWHARGCPEGSAHIDWAEAERQFTSTRSPAVDAQDVSQKDSFPASDPPATHLPDVPPINADDKWSAANVERVERIEDAPTPTATDS